MGDAGRYTGVPHLPMAMTHVADSVPYPWPYDGRLSPTSFVLLVLGDQPSITDRCVQVEPVRSILAGLAHMVRRVGGHVVHVRHGDHTGPFTAPPPSGDLVIEAPGWDALFGSPLESTLRRLGCPTIALGGFGSEVTVDSTVRTLNDRGWECLVLTDACAPFDTELGRRAHASLTMSGGIFGALGTADALIAALTTCSTEGTP